MPSSIRALEPAQGLEEMRARRGARRRAAAVLRARAGSARRSASRGSTTALRSTSRRSSCCRGGEETGDRHRPAHRNHAGGRPAVALRAGAGSRFAQSPYRRDDEADFHPRRRRDACRAAPGRAPRPTRFACGTSRTTRGRSLAGSSFDRACSSLSPVTWGTTPCSALPRKSVTASYEESVPLFGYCCRTIPGRCRALERLVQDLRGFSGWYDSRAFAPARSAPRRRSAPRPRSACSSPSSSGPAGQVHDRQRVHGSSRCPPRRGRSG